jgi:phospholipid/cholesterol/gamma-HCH transport system ATP-binding protein
MGLTIVMVTHDMDSLWHVTNRVAFLGEGKVLCVDAMPELVKNPHPLIQAFFSGARGRVTKRIYD